MKGWCKLRISQASSEKAEAIENMYIYLSYSNITY